MNYAERLPGGVFVTSAALTMGMLSWTAYAAASGHAGTIVAASVALAFVPYALMLGVDPPRWARSPLGPSLAAGVCGLALVCAPSVLSTDLYRYAWDARVLTAGLDPYAYVPDDPALAALRDAAWQHINHRDIATIYPPLAQGLFALGYSLVAAPVASKLLGLVVHVGGVALIGAVARHDGARAAWLWALNPLALSEAALGGHIDALVGLGACALALSLAAGRPARAALWCGALSGLKLIGLALWPLLALRGRLRWVAVALALSLLSLWPLSQAGHATEHSQTGGLGHYAQRWEGNALAFEWLAAAAGWAVDEVADAQNALDGHISLEALEPLVRAAAGTPFDPRAVLTGPKKAVDDPLDFPRHYVASMLARAAACALLLSCIGLLLYRRAAPLVAVRVTVLVLLLLAPQVHPWYLLWLLPIELVLGRHTALVWSAALPVAYLSVDLWAGQRQWVELPVASYLQYACVAGSVLFELLPHARRSARPAPVLAPAAE